MIQFTVPGDPVPQGRPKFTTRGKFPRAYDPPKSRAYKAKVAAVAYKAMAGRMIMSPVCVTVDIYRPIQKSDSRKVHAAKASGEILPMVKPDIDNVFKAVTDALKGIVWQDDNQMCKAIISKKYSDTPRVEVKIEKI